MLSSALTRVRLFGDEVVVEGASVDSDVLADVADLADTVVEDVALDERIGWSGHVLDGDAVDVADSGVEAWAVVFELCLDDLEGAFIETNVVQHHIANGSTIEVAYVNQRVVDRPV